MLLALLPFTETGSAQRYWSRFGGELPFEATPLLGADSAMKLSIPLLSAPCGFDFTLAFENRHSDPWSSYRTLTAGVAGRTKSPAWGFRVSGTDDRELIISIAPEVVERGFDESRSTKISFRDSEGETGLTRPHHFNHNAGSNILRLECRDSVWTLSGGKESCKDQIIAGKLNFRPESIEIFTSPGALINIIHARLEEFPAAEPLPSVEPEALTADSFISRPDPREGFWAPAERDFDEDLIHLGGDYIFAMLSDDEGGFGLYYISGATYNARGWTPGTRKVRLIPAVIPGRYNVEWLDAEGRALSYCIIASFDDAGRLVISFPYQNSSLTLQRIPTPNK